MLEMGIEYVEGAVEVPDGWVIEQLPESPGNSTMVEQELLDLGADSIVVSSERTGYLQYGQGQVGGRNVVAVWRRTDP